MSNSPRYSIQYLADYVEAVFEGDGDFLIDGLSSLPMAEGHHLAFYDDSRYKEKLASTKAGCVLLRGADSNEFSGNKIIVDDPYLSYAKLTGLFCEEFDSHASIHPSAIIASNVKIGEGVTIGPHVVIEDDVSIGSNTKIGAGTYIGHDSLVGSNTTLYPNVSLYHNVCIGDNCIIHSGSVIGSDGFGFAPSSAGWQKIHQLGGVRISDQVEIGANTTVDRGALDNTVIERGVKIDNQVQIAHNVQIGEQTAIAAATAIAGSTVIGKRCTIAGAVGIVGHITITDDVHVTAMTMVTKSINKSGSYSSGVPMNETRFWKKNAARFNQLDNVVRQLQAGKKTATKK